MTTAVVSPFFDFEVMNKNNKLMSYNNNLSAPHPMSVPCTGTNVPISSPTGVLLDRKAVGSPSVGSVYQRRHSVSSTKFNQNQFLNSLKAADHSSLISGVGNASSNKENRLRDRSFSETGREAPQQVPGPRQPHLRRQPGELQPLQDRALQALRGERLLQVR
ncbi:Zinc finger protein 36, C3H1 type-like 1 [Oryzias melastigma]|uniref:Zinc finger protein 36, C3H1 type-like 1 n=1 Tax=Oryzias melastigma TaxID=30732 RepID=A0A834CP03_ORYME|nr:Zinc finger protein 36, C3H1 type-like 1 [Oryzias melastigma]